MSDTPSAADAASDDDPGHGPVAAPLPATRIIPVPEPPTERIDAVSLALPARARPLANLGSRVRERLRGSSAAGTVVEELSPFTAGFRSIIAERDAHAATIRADEITAWFGDHKVLDRVSLTMSAGRVTALIGPSGCGKSTFLRILNRMHELVPSASLAGRVYLGDGDIYGDGQRVTDARRRIGMVFQKANPFPAMSIYDNTIAGLELCGIKVNRAERDYIVEDSLRKASLWNEVKDRLHQPGGGLSGGQQQRLCIARALAISPEVLLMDEPCSALDPTSTRRVEETIAELRGQVTIVIVTHNMQQAARVSD
jgi:phosphate transport system ATP-binding protein